MQILEEEKKAQKRIRDEAESATFDSCSILFIVSYRRSHLWKTEH